MSWAGLITNQTSLSSAHWLLQFLLFSNHMVCVGLNSSCNPCGCLRPNYIPGIRGNFTYSLSTGYRVHWRNRGGGIWRIYEPGSMYLSICVCIYTIVYVSLENPNLYRKVGRDINDCSYKKVAWGIPVMEIFCIWTVVALIGIYTCDKIVQN